MCLSNINQPTYACLCFLRWRAACRSPNDIFLVRADVRPLTVWTPPRCLAPTVSAAKARESEVQATEARWFLVHSPPKTSLKTELTSSSRENPKWLWYAHTQWHHRSMTSQMQTIQWTVTIWLCRKSWPRWLPSATVSKSIFTLTNKQARRSRTVWTAPSSSSGFKPLFLPLLSLRMLSFHRNFWIAGRNLVASCSILPRKTVKWLIFVRWEENCSVPLEIHYGLALCQETFRQL